MDHQRPARLHYAWVILAVTCLTVVLTAGVTAVPAVLIHPLEVAFGWVRAAFALAVSINVFLYGLAGPFAGRRLRPVGPRPLVLAALLMRDTPAALGLAPYGTGHAAASGNPATAPAPEAPLVPLSAALRQGDFWRLWLTFAICGATTNGLIGTHLIPHAIDQGLSAVAAATTLAMMGVLDIAGTLGSGWLSDRYDKRILLASYYGLRGLSLLFLPYADNFTKLALFGVVYGLDWIATVPPTAGLASDLFGTRSGPILFGWVFFGHQVGAALAAYGGGLLHVWFGTYRVAFTTAGLLALGAAILVLTIRQGREPVPTTSPHQTSLTGTSVPLAEPNAATS